ncbi:MAG: putative metal-binding motif-containing protein [Myxococcales bacterium]|nr:putative metal-binding motif-containing protein [Myxococcales bacterium]
MVSSCAPESSAPVSSCPHREVFVYVDGDGDGFGTLEAIGYACSVEEGQAANPMDCNDADPDVNPVAEEVCDGHDNDCDGWVDEDFFTGVWYVDEDRDGYGSDQGGGISFCAHPGPGWVHRAGDCNDSDPLVNPEAREICNGGVDDDCDGRADDLDADVEPSTREGFFRDRDGDGFGDPESALERCEPAPNFVDNADDCDDRDPHVNPLAPTDPCGDGVDQDCDGVDPAC